MKFKKIYSFFTFLTFCSLNYSNAETLTTTTAGNRHQEFNIFDIKALSYTTITGIQQNFADDANYQYQFWFREGSSSGTIPTSAGWQKIGTTSLTIDASEVGSLITVPFENFSLDLGKGKTYGIMVGGDTNHNDLFSEVKTGTTKQTSTSGALVGEVISSDSNLEIYEGVHLQYQALIR